jgi:hypothetical protein
VAGGSDPAADKAALRKAPTVAELSERFRAEHVEAKRKARTAHEYGRLIRALIVPQLGIKKALHVTRADVAKLHHSLRATPYQANRVLAVCSAMFNFAERHDLRPVNTNPCRHIGRFHEAERERMLSAAELAALGLALRQFDEKWAAAKPLLAEIDRMRAERTTSKEAGDRAGVAAATEAISNLTRRISDLGDARCRSRSARCGWPPSPENTRYLPWKPRPKL